MAQFQLKPLMVILMLLFTTFVSITKGDPKLIHNGATCTYTEGGPLFISIRLNSIPSVMECQTKCIELLYCASPYFVFDTNSGDCTCVTSCEETKTAPTTNQVYEVDQDIACCGDRCPVCPSCSPTMDPTPTPTVHPTMDPTPTPTVHPTLNPTETPSSVPTTPSNQPTQMPTGDDDDDSYSY
eukprot:85168_1